MSAPGKAKKGVAPDMKGVAGELVACSEIPPCVVFGSKQRVSPYDALLRQLYAAGGDKALCFGAARARASITARAKKLDIPVTLGEYEGKLYVRLLSGALARVQSASEAKPSPEADARKLTTADARQLARRANILGAIRLGKTSPESIAAHLRAEDSTCVVDASGVRGSLRAMRIANTVVLESVDPERWALAPGM